MELSALPEGASVAVVIPARDAASTLEAAVGSVLTQQVTAPFEVAIAVAPSRDETEAIARQLEAEHAAVRVVPNPAGTTPAALNAAIAATTGDVVVRVDAHAVLPPGYIGRAVQILRETGAANVGGRQVPVADAGFGRAVAAAMRSRVGSGGATYRGGVRPGAVETVYLGVFRREALEAVGAYDETLIRNQDYELNHRLRRGGGVVYFHPDLAVEYRPRSTVRALWRQYFQYGAWKRHVIRRFPGSIRLRQLAAPILVSALAGGFVLAVTWSAWPLTLVAATWLGALIVGSLGEADGPGQVPATVVALATMHLAWGVGFLVGRARAPRPPPRSGPT